MVVGFEKSFVCWTLPDTNTNGLGERVCLVIKNNALDRFVVVVVVVDAVKAVLELITNKHVDRSSHRGDNDLDGIIINIIIYFFALSDQILGIQYSIILWTSIIYYYNVTV